ncbi:hypothetical protein OH77DRAFT_1591035 [Trametes cingulata]|nr:hypothetical protein OH77DRAFT_1591035 [Trametes cingulata]
MVDRVMTPKLESDEKVTEHDIWRDSRGEVKPRVVAAPRPAENKSKRLRPSEPTQGTAEPKDEPNAPRPSKRARATPLIDFVAISASKGRRPAALPPPSAFAFEVKSESPMAGSSAPQAMPSAKRPALPGKSVRFAVSLSNHSNDHGAVKATAPSPPPAKSAHRAPRAPAAAAQLSSARHRLDIINSQLAALQKERMEIKAELSDDDLQAVLRGE